MNLQFVITFIQFFVFCKCQWSTVELSTPDIYWKEYTGVIPHDAIPGGVDSNNETTYIGQGYVQDKGIIPGVIYLDSKQMTVSSFGTKVINSHIKILCSSDPSKLQWIPVKADKFHLASINKYVVRGGEETDHVVYIGRVGYKGEVITGKIVSGPYETPGKAIMYFVYGNKEIGVVSYQVLVLDPHDMDISSRISIR